MNNEKLVLLTEFAKSVDVEMWEQSMDKVPILPKVSDEQAERLAEFTFFAHKSDVARIKEFAKVNGLDINIKGNLGRSTVPESQLDGVLKFLTGETEFEKFLEAGREIH